MAKNRPQPKPIQPSVRSSAGSNKPKTSSRSWFRMPTSQNKELLFDKTNYILMAVSGILIILGFILMSGGNQNPKVFNADEIYSFRRITLAPIVVVSGFLVMVLAILKKPSGGTTES